MRSFRSTHIPPASTPTCHTYPVVPRFAGLAQSLLGRDYSLSHVASLVRHAARDYGPRNPHCRDAPLNFKSFCGSSLSPPLYPRCSSFRRPCPLSLLGRDYSLSHVASLVRHAANEQRLTQPTLAVTPHTGRVLQSTTTRPYLSPT